MIIHIKVESPEEETKKSGSTEEGWSMSCLKIITSNGCWNGCSNEPRAGKRGKWHGQRIKKVTSKTARAAVTGNHHFVQERRKRRERLQTQDAVRVESSSSIHYQIATGVCVYSECVCVCVGRGASLIANQTPATYVGIILLSNSRRSKYGWGRALSADELSAICTAWGLPQRNIYLFCCTTHGNVLHAVQITQRVRNCNPLKELKLRAFSSLYVLRRFVCNCYGW